MSEPDWEIPLNLQPEPGEYRYDLAHALRAIVSLRASVPADAFTAETLGTERTGSGVCVRLPGAPEGLILTIGYLITEAETIWLVAHDGRAMQATPLAFDQATGFVLVMTLGRLEIPALEIGDSSRVALGDQLVRAAGGGLARAMETKLVGRQEFAGYWEYLLDEALFTAPAHPFWSGSALIDADGRLIGIGSLILQQGDNAGQRADMNMVVPINLLKPVAHNLLTTGTSGLPARPWLGVFVMEGDNGLVVGGMADNGPAERAGVRAGDQVVGIDGEEVSEVSALWRALWEKGNAGAAVRLDIIRDGNPLTIRVITGDRSKALRSPRMH